MICTNIMNYFPLKHDFTTFHCALAINYFDNWYKERIGMWKREKKWVTSSNNHKNVLINCTHATWARVAPKSNLINGSTIQKAAALESIYLFQLENYTYLVKKKKKGNVHWSSRISSTTCWLGLMQKSHLVWLTSYIFLLCQISISSKTASQDLSQCGNSRSAASWGYFLR